MPTVSERILFVDDERAILDSFRRQFRKEYALTAALGPEEGLTALVEQGPFAVVVSDYKMPGMNGVEFLSRVRERSPQTVRVMLTGQADWEATVRAVNEGSIFRFLTKPCDLDVLRIALDDGLAQWRLIHAERELLQRTLVGSIKVLTDVLSLVNPAAFSRAQRVKRTVERYLPLIGRPDAWQVPLAAMLSQIGCVTLPVDLLERQETGEHLTPQEQQMFHAHPSIGHDVLVKIPRLREIAEIVARQLDPMDDATSGVAPQDRPLTVVGAQLLHIALAVDDHVLQGETESEALRAIREYPAEYCPMLVDTIRERVTHDVAEVSIIELPVSAVSINMVLADNVYLTDGVLLVGKGQEISEIVLQRMKNFARQGLLVDGIRVIDAVKRKTVADLEAELEEAKA